jgi:hypothetical protein
MNKIIEKGPFRGRAWATGGSVKIVIASDDFTHDVVLEVHGDFESIEEKQRYANEIARRLNKWETEYGDDGNELTQSRSNAVHQRMNDNT